jgi:hypothetical protein
VHRVLWTYLGWRRFPHGITSFEARRFLSFSAQDQRELRIRYAPRQRIAAALQLGFVRLTGTTHDAFDYAPRSVLDLVDSSNCRPRSLQRCALCIGGNCKTGR